MAIRLLLAFVALGAPPAFAATVPAEFRELPVASGLASPTAMQFAPDGRLFVAEQAGTLRVIKNGALLSVPFVSLNVSAAGERGLLGIAFDPAFVANQFVYLYYTATTPAVHNRISRFTANGDVAVAGSEVVIFDLDNLSAATNHNGGALAFGPDGKLYVGVGENGTGANAQSLTTVLGKMLRINNDGTIPADNPFYGTATGKNRAVWALGLRNPFSFAFNPAGTEMFINDVGENTFEEIDDGRAGANYGWPDTEGATSDSRFVGPRFVYDHSDGSCAIAGAAFYSPLTAQFTDDFLHDYFFADYCGGWIRRLDPAAGNKVTDFASGIASPVDLKIADDGSLYYLARGSSATSGVVVRIVRATSAPTISAHPQSVTVQPGSPVTFSVDASGTPPLRYQWQRNGVDLPGATARTYTIASATPADNGARFRVIVTNDSGNVLSNDATLTVSGNQAPVGTIIQPTAGTLYAGGTLIEYSGTGTDAEDGTLPPGAFTWWVDFQHDTHVHPFILPTTGARGGSFIVPTTGHTEANVWYRIYLTVTDSGGLTHTSQRDVLPRVVSLTLATNPPGLQLKLDDQPVTTPLAVDSVVGIIRTIEAITPQSIGGVAFAWNAWSDGGTVAHTVSTPAASTTFTASYGSNIGGPAGLLVTYFDNSDFTGEMVTRVDPAIDFDWGEGSPAPGIGADTFSVRWIGQVEPSFTEPYTFFTQTDDGVRLWVNGQLIIDNWTDHGETENSGTVSLTTGRLADIVMEYYENGGRAEARLLWSSPSTPKAVVPSARLHPVVVAGGDPQMVYLSDLPWTSAQSGWGPIERDRSNGDFVAHDGHLLTLGGVTFSKGLGMHAPAINTYTLPSGCSQFQAQVGVDDETIGNGSLAFEVWADGVKLYSSSVLTGGGYGASVNLALSGQTELRLIVTDGGDGAAYDHADWAMARVTCPPAAATPVIYLSDLPGTTVVNGWGPLELDRSNGDAAAGDGGPIALTGLVFPKGLGVHAPSDIRYALPAGCSQFRADVGLDDEVGVNGRVTFEVWADGVRLYGSPVVTGGGVMSANVNVPLSGQTELQLVVTDGGDGVDFDHADWAMARLTCR